MFCELLEKLRKLIKEIEETTETDIRILQEMWEIVDRLGEFE